MSMIKVRLPATCANLGPGFDCMGLALDLWNTFELHVPDLTNDIRPVFDSLGIVIEPHGEGATSLPTDASNLVVQTMLAELERLNNRESSATNISESRHSPYAASHLRIVCRNDVPCASGLGSSSTAVLAGLIFAHTLRGEDYDTTAILTRAVAIEGHGDNVAPALLGGLIVVSYDGFTIVTAPIPIPQLRVVVCVPAYDYLTSDARAALPAMVSRADAVFNTGRAMLVIEALQNGSDALLARAMGDRIHEPYRLPAIPGACEARQEALTCGATAVCLSGAGPGLLAFARDDHHRIGRAMQGAFARAGLSARCWVLNSSARGIEIHRG